MQAVLSHNTPGTKPHLSPLRSMAEDVVVKCSARYLSTSANSRACSIGVYAAVAPCCRHSMRNGSSDCEEEGETCCQLHHFLCTFLQQ